MSCTWKRGVRGGGNNNMAFDASPTESRFQSPHPSASSPSPSHNFSSGRHFYVAVDRIQFKMETLVDLLGVTGRRPDLPIVVCCSSRDELDAVCSAVSNISYISLSLLYSDLSEAERVLTLDKFRQAAIEWNQTVGSYPIDNNEIETSAQKSNMIVVTDACLPFASSGEHPILARVLINFELPTKKETYLRRMSMCVAADGIVINMVVGGEVVTLRSIEESCGFIINEMPINASPPSILRLGSFIQQDPRSSSLSITLFWNFSMQISELL